MKKNELEDRLIDFASVVILFTEGMKNNYAGNHLSGQIIRSSTSPALNYGEAQSSESKKLAVILRTHKKYINVEIKI